jgi:hypothetical protein
MMFGLFKAKTKPKPVRVEIDLQPLKKTVGMLRNELARFNPMSILTDSVFDGRDDDLHPLASRIDIDIKRPTRLLREGEEGYVAGIRNRIYDESQQPRVYVKAKVHDPSAKYKLTYVDSRRDGEPPPVLVSDLLTKLAEIKDDAILVHAGDEGHLGLNCDATSIFTKEFEVKRLLRSDEPGYVEGLQNQTFDETKRVVLRINGVDWSRYSY